MPKTIFVAIVPVTLVIFFCFCIRSTNLAASPAASSDTAVGVSMVNLSTNEIFYQSNADRLFIPASVQKIITALAALHYLGAGFQFETKLFTNQFDRKNGVLHNLYLVGAGDPSLTVANLDKLVAALKQQGVKKVIGSIYIDNQSFDDQAWGPGWLPEDLSQGFAAPISALAVEGNRIILEILPGAALGQQAVVLQHPYSSYIAIVNRAKTCRSGTISANSIATSPTPGLKKGQRVVVSDCIVALSKPTYSSFSVADPISFAGFLLKEKLAQYKISSAVRVSKGNCPTNARLLAINYSPLLSTIVSQMLKFSQNHVADTLFKAIGRHFSGQTGTFCKGQEAIYKFLTNEVGVDRKHLVVADGSGLSTHNRITPSALTKIITYGIKAADIGPEFLASLPVAGSDGTLKNYFAPGRLNNYLRAKTGSMTGLHQLSGYLYASSGHEYVFAILGDQNLASEILIKQFQDTQLHKLLNK